jgi:proline racemase
LPFFFHAQGEIGKVITGGGPEISGATLLEKMNHINRVDDSLRRFVTPKPRAHDAVSTNLLLPSTRPAADAGFIACNLTARTRRADRTRSAR